MNLVNKKKIIRISTLAAKIAGVVFVIALLAFFGLRNYFLDKAVEKVKGKLLNQYQTQLSINSYGFKGLAGVEMKGLTVVPLNRDTLFSAEEFSLSIKLLYALIGDIRIKEVALSNGYLQVTKRDSIRNIDYFIGKKEDSSLVVENENVPATSAEKPNYSEVVYKLINKVLNKVPSNVTINNFGLRGVDEQTWVWFTFNQLNFSQGKVGAMMRVETNTSVQQWQLTGTANPQAKQADLMVSRADTGRLMFPYLPERFNLQTGFGSARMVINGIELDNGELSISGLASMNSFFVNHPKISSKDVVVDQMEFNYLYKIGSNYVMLDSSSKVNFNGILFHPFVYYQNGPDTIYQLVVRTEKTEAGKFIEALPEGLFSHIKGMEATGSFTYRLDFYHNENKPDAMVFESALEKDQFRIIRYGEADLGKLNQEFVHYPIENGRRVRPIVVGPSNPSYVPLDAISPILRKTILTTEDPSFYWHRGFVGEAFRQSIAKNIRTGKFKRGASTISMQLVKNVFLTREKTMARKLEEILLVYILENNYITSKDRMFEVYLNIIEWGPNVYGIGEACQFYFQKSPSALTLSESLFLATIIPSPKKFMWRFGKDGLPRPWLERSFKMLANKMLTRQLIVPEDTLGLTHLVNISGYAKKYIVVTDTLNTDSLLEQQLLRQVDEGRTDDTQDE